MKRTAYRGTEVPVERSQSHIRELLYRYGADGIQFSESRKEGKIQMRFMYEVNGDPEKVVYFVRIEAVVLEPGGRSGTAAMERKQHQAGRAAWRAVYWALKSRMESINYGIETFEQAFLAHFEAGIDEHGRTLTVGERIIPRLRAGQIALPEKAKT